MTDKELGTSVRDLFDALRRSIHAAQQAGLIVQFGDRVKFLLENPGYDLRGGDLTIARPL